MERTCVFPNCRGDTTSKEYFCDRHEIYRKIEADLVERHADTYPPGAAKVLHAVYVMGASGVGAVKVGIAGDVMSRLAQIQTGFPARLSLYGAFYTSRPFAETIEKECHRVLTDFDMHLNGEWFDVDPGDACSVVVKCASNIGLPVLGCSEYWALLSSEFGPMTENARSVSDAFGRIRRDFVPDIVDKAGAA